jgi:hypothetical protein
MFHLLISHSGWSGTKDELGPDRIFEYTENHIKEQFRFGGELYVEEIRKIPALFASETHGSGSQLAKIGSISSALDRGGNIKITYHFDPDIPPVANEDILKLADELDISGGEFRRTHWAIKDVDLFKVLHKANLRHGPSPSVFSFADLDRVESDLVSVMMPFASQFTSVYQALQQLSSDLGLKCLRADDIWNHDAVIQDVVSLICRSKIVVCDCTDRNANVFYEAGVAHSLGKDVILITQNGNDIPFDLRHLRYVTYLNNGEGLMKLATDLRPKIQQLTGL